MGLPHIAHADARLFILGSLPGDASLAAGQYYAHPQNQFWRLVGSLIDEDLHLMPYAARLKRLAERRIGLWDVIGSAVREHLGNRYEFVSITRKPLEFSRTCSVNTRGAGTRS